MSSMSLQCPACGRQADDPETQCECGFSADTSFIDEPVNGVVQEANGKKDNNIDEQENIKHVTAAKRSKKPPANSLIIKEVDSWKFMYSPDDECIYLGTPALQSFRLKLSLNDIEQLLEYMYDKTGQEKTTRKLELSAKEINDLIDKIQAMIEEKRSKALIKFSDGELKNFAELINKKLKA